MAWARAPRPLAGAEVEPSLPGGPGVFGIAFQQVQVVGEAVALEPGDRRLQLGQRHLRRGPCPSPASAPRCRRGARTARRAGCAALALVLHHLRRDQLADLRRAAAAPPRRAVQQVRLLGRRCSGRGGGEVRPGRAGVCQRSAVALEASGTMRSRALPRRSSSQDRQLALAARLAARGRACPARARSARGSGANSRSSGWSTRARCACVGAGVRVDPGGARHHLLQPGARADMGQRGAPPRPRARPAPHRPSRTVTSTRGLRPQPEGGQRLVRVALVRGGDAHRVLGLAARHPAAQPGRGSAAHSPGRAPPPAACRGPCAVSPGGRPSRARRRSARRSRVASKARRSRSSAKPVRSAVNSAARVDLVGAWPETRCGPECGRGRRPRVQPVGLAVQRAEVDRQHRALGQRLGAAVAHHRPAGRGEVDLPRPARLARAGRAARGCAGRPPAPACRRAAGARRRSLQQRQDGAADQARRPPLAAPRRRPRRRAGRWCTSSTTSR